MSTIIGSFRWWRLLGIPRRRSIDTISTLFPAFLDVFVAMYNKPPAVTNAARELLFGGE
jgi:hypothetical protein